ncbi:MAG: hypothetical protein WCK17_19095, partial [Verrucomicrobiota bacterium]
MDDWRGWHHGHQFICNKSQEDQFAFLFDWLKNDLISEDQAKRTEKERAAIERHRNPEDPAERICYSLGYNPDPKVLLSTRSSSFVDKADNAPPPW